MAMTRMVGTDADHKACVARSLSLGYATEGKLSRVEDEGPGFSVAITEYDPKRAPTLAEYLKAQPEAQQ